MRRVEPAQLGVGQHQLQARTVAFPAISCGIYGYPVDEAAPVAVDTVRTTPTEVEIVRFVLFDAGTFATFQRCTTP